MKQKKHTEKVKINLQNSVNVYNSSAKASVKQSPQNNLNDVTSILKTTTQIKKSSVMGSIMESISEKSDFNVKKDDFEINRTNNLIDKIITAVGDNPKKLKKGLNKIIGLGGNKNLEINFLNKLESVVKNFSDLTLTSAEENTNSELVEKGYLDNLKKENEILSNEIKILKDKNVELKHVFRKTSGEALFLRDVSESQDKLKSEDFKKIKKLNDDITENELLERTLKDKLTIDKLEKDNLYRALMSYTKYYDSNIAQELEKIYKSYNNQFFLATYRPTDEKKVEDLLGSINYLEKEIKKKEADLDLLNKIYVPDKKKNNLPLLKKQPTLRSIPSFKKKPTIK